MYYNYHTAYFLEGDALEGDTLPGDLTGLDSLTPALTMVF